MPTRGDLAVADLDTARAVIATLQEQLARSQRDNAALRHQLDVLCRRLFGRRSEKVDPSQLRLALEQLANESGPASAPIEMDSGETPVRGHARRASTGRRPFPPDLPREVTVVDLPDADKVCGCGGTKITIGAATSEKLEYVPASFFIRETARLTYACPQCHAGVTEAPAPPQAVEKSLAGEGLLAHVVVSKYADHLPRRHRQDHRRQLSAPRGRTRAEIPPRLGLSLRPRRPARGSPSSVQIPALRGERQQGVRASEPAETKRDRR